MTTISFFAGVGGIDLAFEQAGFQAIWANEIDGYAAQTYRANFTNPLIQADIRTLDIETIPDADILLAGFPCQAFSVAGYRKGFYDERGNLFFDLLKIIEAKKPSILFLENVKNLVGHDQGKTFRIIIDALEINGYFVKYQVLNAAHYGNIPQNRERIYIVAFRKKDHYFHFDFPKPQELTTQLSDLINYQDKVDEKYYYTSEKNDFYPILEAEMQRIDTLYQWRRQYVRENKSGLCPTLTANMGTGGHNVPLVKTPLGIRKLTPRECFNLQGFPKEFRLPLIAQSKLYTQAGNSVVVSVIHAIAQEIKKALNKRIIN
ncbi:DNA cytosine methyltransferase [Entomospira culicis]|uniref:Cytosine-specific methyltransferase n=1 Tax=Entomospira culicis TaxID=2719989 RepID=A0A968KU38_9SPIO|nr:DNA cytosine methyltransferase [Entomospira culicis]NIZ18549.1 DNA cytosine methyltransferase [Entomospira culicis]NIZ68765.1 DNA cytosine methyltransferase [Entomospira culicis]WDI37361.1 DNA cytosine methyltransferase [Entomospira culicis]WDI38990.1 DNA cytosine methyltransferase [Entomospira culicis]